MKKLGNVLTRIVNAFTPPSLKRKAAEKAVYEQAVVVVNGFYDGLIEAGKEECQKKYPADDDAGRRLGLGDVVGGVERARKMAFAQPEEYRPIGYNAKEGYHYTRGEGISFVEAFAAELCKGSGDAFSILMDPKAIKTRMRQYMDRTNPDGAGIRRQKRRPDPNDPAVISEAYYAATHGRVPHPDGPG